MGDSSYEQGATISTDGITIHQLYTSDEFEVPSVVLKLVSNRQEPVRVTLTVPDIDVERIGFHPDFGQDAWTLHSDKLEFEAELEPDTDLTTLYAVDSPDKSMISRAIRELEITEITPLDTPENQSDLGAAKEVSVAEGTDNTDPLAEDVFVDIRNSDPQDIENEDVVADDTSDTGDSPDDILIDTDDFDTDIEPGSSLTDDPDSSTDSAQTNDDGATQTNETSDEDPAKHPFSEDTMNRDTDTIELASLSTEVLIEELDHRIEVDNLSEEHRQRLASLSTGVSANEQAHDAKISHLQSRMSDIEAYHQSMEEVFDEHGDPATIFGDFEERVEELEAELDDMKDQVESTPDWDDTVEPRLQSVEQEVEEQSEDLDDVDEQVEDLQSELNDLQRWRKKVTGGLKTFMED
ncbi:hypothetical protein [Halovenus marina]|uniref:hypothetical protein n=1 Tax=Halovenus marina TaxID=3396621 RepID=UPI003F5713A8